jgi:hypothetical protein
MENQKAVNLFEFKRNVLLDMGLKLKIVPDS